MAVLQVFQIPYRTMWWSPFLAKLQNWHLERYQGFVSPLKFYSGMLQNFLNAYFYDRASAYSFLWSAQESYSFFSSVRLIWLLRGMSFTQTLSSTRTPYTWKIYYSIVGIGSVCCVQSENCIYTLHLYRLYLCVRRYICSQKTDSDPPMASW